MAKRHSIERRNEIISLFQQGASKSAIAKQFDMAICSVSYIISNYLKTAEAAADANSPIESVDNLVEAITIACKCSAYGFESAQSAKLISQLGCSKEDIQRLYQWFGSEAKAVPFVTYQQMNAQLLNQANELRIARNEIANLKQSYHDALIDAEEAKQRATFTDQLVKEIEACKEVCQSLNKLLIEKVGGRLTRINTSALERQSVVKAIELCVDTGAFRVDDVCDLFALSSSVYYRWKQNPNDGDKRISESRSEKYKKVKPAGQRPARTHPSSLKPDDVAIVEAQVREAAEANITITEAHLRLMAEHKAVASRSTYYRIAKEIGVTRKNAPQTKQPNLS